MHSHPSPIDFLRSARLKSDCDPIAYLGDALSRANGNAGRNTYITFDPDWSMAELRRQTERVPVGQSNRPLLGLPVSLKDCFDLQGFPTSGGSKFYAKHFGIANKDSAIAAALKAAGAVITGKTHMQQLAYGITGENRDYGNCLQPDDSARLTGGSSSGAAASIQEGSAFAAIGTDTGGSIRVPAAICGLAGYRSSHGVADWNGGMHLAPSFDTVGWIFRDLRDARLLAEAIFRLPPAPIRNGHETDPIVIGILAGPLVEGCDPVVARSLETWKERLLRQDIRLKVADGNFWPEAWEIYAPLQAYEAAKIHAGFFHEFEPAITERLEWGAAMGEEEIRNLRQRQQDFCSRMRELFQPLDFLLAPATPLNFLSSAHEQSEARAQILRLTTPASIAGLPAVVLPSRDCGLQLLARHNDDLRLLHFAAGIGRWLAEDPSESIKS